MCASVHGLGARDSKAFPNRQVTDQLPWTQRDTEARNPQDSYSVPGKPAAPWPGSPSYLRSCLCPGSWPGGSHEMKADGQGEWKESVCVHVCRTGRWERRKVQRERKHQGKQSLRGGGRRGGQERRKGAPQEGCWWTGQAREWRVEKVRGARYRGEWGRRVFERGQASKR